VLTVMSITLFIISIQIFLNEEKDFQLFVDNNHRLIHETYDLAEIRIKEKFLMHLNTLDVAHIKELIETKQRDKLYQKLHPIYNKLQASANKSLTVYSFYLPDGTAFLRLHKPEKFGDNNYETRHLIRKSIITKKLASGYEIGKFGLLYRIEYPLIQDDKLICIIDLGIYFNEFDIYLKSIAPISSVSILSSKAQKRLHDSDFNYSFENSSFIYGDKIATKLFDVPEIRKNLREEEVIHYKNYVYSIHIVEITNTSKEIIAQRIYFSDVTKAYQHRYKTVIIHIIISLITLLFTALILNKNFEIILGQLLTSENHFKMLFENMKNAIIVFSVYDDTVIYKNINQSAQKLLGRDKADVIGTSLNESTFLPKADCLTKAIIQVYITREAIQHPCIQYQKDQISSWRENYIYTLSNNEIVVIINDVTQQKQDEQIKQRLQRSLHEKNALYKKLTLELDSKIQKQTGHMLQQSRLAQMGEMISMIAHQWRQPLASISAISGTLSIDIRLDEYKKEFFLERLDAISELSSHLSLTIDDFRSFFKEDKEMEVTDLEEMVNASLRIIGPVLETKGIRVDTSFENKDKFKTYHTEINQVLLNILKNAEDAFLEKKVKDPKIQIIAYAQGNNVCIDIKDNAGGIPEEIIEDIFDPYFSTKIKKDGTGLGLYMSKTIITEHCGGSIKVKNINDGVCFTLILPLIIKNHKEII